jgi:hypothetical protein
MTVPQMSKSAKAPVIDASRTPPAKIIKDNTNDLQAPVFPPPRREPKRAENIENV